MARKFNLAEAAFGQAVLKQDPNKVVRIPIDDIEENDYNFYSMEGIEELAESIKLVGLMEPVRVVHQPEEIFPYRLISGHRRTAAYDMLRDTTGDDRWAEIPALVMEDMDDLTETFALVTANATARELTYGEKCKQEEELRRVLMAWKKAGKEVPRNLGQYIADQIGTSRNEVSRMHSINENLIPEARELVDKGEMTAQKAYDLSRKPEAEQKDAIDGLKKVVDGNLSVFKPPEVDYKATQSAALSWARASVRDWARDAVFSVTRSESIDYMKDRRGNSAHGGFGESDYCAWGKSKQVDLKHFGVSVTWTELWDALALAALEWVAKRNTAPRPAADLWHTEPPEKTGEYVCMYRTPSGETSCGIYKWRDQWMKYGQPVGDVYKILRWTEVPR